MIEPGGIVEAAAEMIATHCWEFGRGTGWEIQVGPEDWDEISATDIIGVIVDSDNAPRMFYGLPLVINPTLPRGAFRLAKRGQTRQRAEEAYERIHDIMQEPVMLPVSRPLPPPGSVGRYFTPAEEERLTEALRAFKEGMGTLGKITTVEKAKGEVKE